MADLGKHLKVVQPFRSGWKKETKRSEFFNLMKDCQTVVEAQQMFDLLREEKKQWVNETFRAWLYSFVDLGIFQIYDPNEPQIDTTQTVQLLTEPAAQVQPTKSGPVLHRSGESFSNGHYVHEASCWRQRVNVLDFQIENKKKELKELGHERDSVLKVTESLEEAVAAMEDVKTLVAIGCRSTL
jgi:hypothetical protein